MGEIANRVPPEARVSAGQEIFEDSEYFKQEKICPDCRQGFVVNVSKHQFSRDQAQAYFDRVTVCGACKNKDKIAAAAQQMKGK